MYLTFNVFSLNIFASVNQSLRQSLFLPAAVLYIIFLLPINFHLLSRVLNYLWLISCHSKADYFLSKNQLFLSISSHLLFLTRFLFIACFTISWHQYQQKKNAERVNHLHQNLYIINPPPVFNISGICFWYNLHNLGHKFKVHEGIFFRIFQLLVQNFQGMTWDLRTVGL